MIFSTPKMYKYKKFLSIFANAMQKHIKFTFLRKK